MTKKRKNKFGDRSSGGLHRCAVCGGSLQRISERRKRRASPDRDYNHDHSNISADCDQYHHCPADNYSTNDNDCGNNYGASDHDSGNLHDHGNYHNDRTYHNHGYNCSADHDNDFCDHDDSCSS